MSVKAGKQSSYVKNGSALRPARAGVVESLRDAARAVVEQLEGRQLMAADPFANENDVQNVPFVLEFDGSSATGLHDKDGEHLGFTRVQVNKNGRSASYVQANLDQVNGTLRLTTTGSATSGSNFNNDNTLTNAIETQFNGSTSGFSITTRLVGPLSYINEPSEQAGISFGPDHDNYIKLVAVSRPEGTRLQFVDEQLVSGSYNHVLDATRDIGSFASISTLDLRIVGDAATGKVRALFSVNGAAFQQFTQEITLTGTRKAAFFATNARAGLVAAHKNASGAITAVFDRFEIQPGTPVSGRPSVAAVNPTPGSTGVQRDQFVSAQLNLTGGGISSGTLSNATVKLYRTSDRALVDANVGTSGAGDVIILTPTARLAANTSYTFEVTEGLQDVAGNAFQAFTSTFTTGTTGGEVDGSYSFEKVELPNATGEEFTSLKVGPDGKLYAGTVDGRIIRYTINNNGTLGSSQVLNVIRNANGGAKRLLTGFTFDPASTANNPILWVTHGQYRFGLQPNGTNDEQKYADDWTGKISKITNLGGSNTGTLTDIVTGLPRSVRDHLTNQPSFGPDGALYIPQGSNSAGGAPDVGWGNRPERLLSGAILRLDPSAFNRTTALNVKTQDGGTYNPFAVGAQLTLYATGVRNAYDLVWTSDGFLYAPTNGTAAGANTPAGGGAPALTNIGAQHDFLFKIVQNGYYGHPNPLRSEYVLGGGYTPGNGVGPNEVPEYGSTTQPDSDYKGYAYDFDLNISPNGIIEYKNASAFGGALKGKLIVTRYSGPDDLMVLTKDAAGNITQAQKGVTGLGGFVDPLDIVENPSNGFLYVSEYSERDASKRKITLLRPIPAGAKATPDKPRLVFTDIQNSSASGSGASPAQTITIKNTGTQPLTIPSGGVSIVDDPALSGNHASEFEAVNWPSLPATIAVGESISFQVRFRATSDDLKAALLRIQSNSSGGTLDVNLRGIGTRSEPSGDVGGDTEPSLQRILDAFQIPVKVGDANPDDYLLPTPRPAGTVHDEIEMQRMVKAGAGPVRIEPLAEYAFNTKVGSVAHVGYYTPGTRDAKTELFRVDVSERTSTNPTWGSTFDPGDAPFALYGEFASGSSSNLFDINGLSRGVYSEDVFNTWDTQNKKKIRFFPLKNADGSVVPDAYVFAFEEYNSGYDSNDIVGIIRNVKPAANGPEIGTQNLDRQSSNEAGGSAVRVLSPTLLSFNRIQTDPSGVPDNVVHDEAKLRIRNSGNQALTINSLVLSNTQHFQLVSPPAAGTQIAAGSFLDVTVRFIATSGRIKTGTITINSNDADEPATQVNLVGYWQNRSENNEEPTLEEFMQLFGYGTQMTYPGEQLSIPGDEGKVRRTGDEVLSAYWRRSNPAAAVEVIQLAAFHTQGNTAAFKWYLPGTPGTTPTVFTHHGHDGQSILPRLTSGGQLAAGTFEPIVSGDSNPRFGFKVDNEWSDPTKNTPQEKPGGGYGHHIRFWVAKDLNGNIIPNTYIMGMDYSGINYDYQDNLYLIRNVIPASGPSAPSGASANASGAGIAIDWSDNTEANLAGYNVYRGTTSGFTPGSGNKLNTAGLLTSSDFNDIFAPTGSASFYKIAAVDNAGNESGFTTVSATRTNDTTPPAIPAGLTITGSASAITLDWDNNTESDLAGYDVLRATSVNGTYTKQNTSGLLTTSSFVDSTAADGVTYFYRVIAKDQSGNSSSPATGQGQRGGTVGEPSAPTNLLASGTSSTTASLTWSAATNAVSYRVERKGPNDANYVEIAVGVTTTSYNDSGLQPSSVYQYRVRAENGVGLSGYSNVDSAATASGPVTAPAAPTGLGATAFSVSQINLSWNASSGAASYRIERRILGAASFDEIASGVTATTYQDTGREANTTYEYRVRAENAVGTSDYSNTAQATTPAVQNPGSLSGVAIGTTGSHTVVTEGSAYDVTAGGAGITGTSDQFYFLYRQVTGDFDVKLRVEDITGGNVQTRAGIMARTSLSATSTHAYISASDADGFRSARRTTDGGTTATTKNGTPGFPNAWVRLQRVGNTITAYYGSNGTTWTQVFSQSIALGSTVYLGLASSAYGGSTSVGNYALRDFGDTTPTTPVTPGVPGTLTATPTSTSTIDLAWQAGTNAASYRVERKGPGDADFVEIATNVTATSYQDTGRQPNTAYEYRVRSVSASGTLFSGYSNVASATTPNVAAPAAPTNLDAIAASHTQVNLTWTASSGATSYRVERRVLGAATWDEIASNVVENAYIDTGRTPETTYEYRVRAENAGGPSDYSNVDSVTTPAAPTPSAYTGTPIGTTGSHVTVTEGSAYDITSSGAGITGNSDQFYFLSRSVTGDFDVKVRIENIEGGYNLTRGGIMARASLTGTSPHVFMGASSGDGFRSARRTTDGGATTVTKNGTPSFPNAWVRLQRVGNTFTAYYSANGTTWTQAFSQVIALPQTLQLGLAGSAYNSSSPTFKFREFGDTNTTVPAPGAPTDLTATPSTTTAISLAWQPGANATGYLVERRRVGEANFVQVVTNTPNTSLLDTGLLSNTTYEYRVRSIGANGGLSVDFSNVASATTQPEVVQPPAIPSGLDAVAASHTTVNLTWNASANATSYRIERRVLGAANFDEIASGVTPTTYQDTNRTPETTYEYRVRAENSAGMSDYSAIDSVTMPAAPVQSYTSADVASNLPGSTNALPDGQSFDIVAGGGNIQATSDSFRFVYRELTGDFDVAGQLTNLTDTNGSPKAGFMARTDLSATSPNVYAHIASNGYRISRRATVGANTDIASNGGMNTYPNTWLRLKRAGDTFTAYRSVDGTNWITIGSYTTVLPQTMLVGMAVTAQSSTQTTTATFRNVQDIGVTPTPTPTPTPAPTTVVRLDVGSTTGYTDSAGKVWSPDAFSSGGGSNTNPFAVNNSIDDPLLYTRRTGTFNYSIPVDNGDYTLRLLFADYYQPGQRQFDVTVEGQQALTNFDITGEAGLNNGVAKSFAVTVNDGKLDVSFVPIVGNASLSALELVPVTTATGDALPNVIIDDDGGEAR